MNNRLWVLTIGELSRLNKYGVFSISVLVAFIWGAVLFLVADEILVTMLPFVLFIDATMMSIMYIGAEMYFEKSESTISTMLVTPVSNNEMVLSKVLANTVHNLFSSLLIVTVFFVAGEMEFIAGLGINLFLVILGIVVATMAFTILGLFLSYYQKDFTDLLVTIFVLSFGLMIPSILMLFGVIEGEFWENVMLANPMQAALEVIGAGLYPAGGSIDLGYEYYVSLAYLVFGGAAVYLFLAIPRFQDYAIKQSGV